MGIDTFIEIKEEDFLAYEFRNKDVS